MCRTLSESNSGSYAGRIAPPGIPNTTSAPTRSSDLTRDCAPVSSSALSFSDISGLLALAIPPLGSVVDVTPAHRRSSCQQKTPAAGWQARERVGDELGLSRHADVREGFLRCARGNNSRRTGRVNSDWRTSCDPEGRSGALVNANLEKAAGDSGVRDGFRQCDSRLTFEPLEPTRKSRSAPVSACRTWST